MYNTCTTHVVIISSVPLYLKTWPKWLRVLSLAPVSTTLTVFYLEPLRKTSLNSKKPRTSSPVLLPCSSPQSCSPRTLLQQLHWLPVKHRIDFKIANITFRTLHCSQPAYLRSSLHACHSTRSLRLSNTNLLSAPFVRTSFGSRSFSVAVPKIWNSLPLSLRTCTSPDTFVVTSRPTTASRPSTPLNPSHLAPQIRLCWPLCAFINYIYLLTYLLLTYLLSAAFIN